MEMGGSSSLSKKSMSSWASSTSKQGDDGGEEDKDPNEYQFGLRKTQVGNDIYLTPFEEHKYTIIWLHGLGDTAEGWLDCFYCECPIIPNQNTKVVMLTAPKQSVTINGGAVMTSWYDIMSFSVPPKLDEGSIATSTRRVCKVIDTEAKILKGDYSKIFLGGFS